MKMNKLNTMLILILFGSLILSTIPLSSSNPFDNPNSMGFSVTDNHVTVNDVIEIVSWVDVTSEIETAAIENLTYLPVGLLHYISTTEGNLSELFTIFSIFMEPESGMQGSVINNNLGYAHPILCSGSQSE